MGAYERGAALMAVRRQQEQSSRLPFVLALVVAVTGVGLLWVRLPGLAVTVVALAVAGAVHPAPVLTGVEGTGGSRRAVPGTPSQKRAMARHTRLAELRMLPLPVGLWPVQTSALAGLGAAFVAGSLAVVPPSERGSWLAMWGPWVNGLAAFLLVSGVERVWRTTRSENEPGPGTPIELLASGSRECLVIVALLAVAGGVFGAALSASLRWWVSSVGLACAGMTLVGAACGVWTTCRKESWEPWQLREKARRQWGPRWAMVPKEEQPPALVERLVDGPLTVDTFRPRPGRDLAYYVKATPRLAAAVGGATTVRVLPAPVANEAGTPELGTVDPALFRIAMMPADADEGAVSDQDLLAAFQWADRWARVPKVNPAPVFLHRETVGPYVIDTFDAPGQPSSEMLRASSRVAVGVGAGLSTAVVPEQEEGRPGSIHPTRFRVAVCDPGERVDVSEADEDVVRMRLECFLTEAADDLHQDVVALTELELLTVDGAHVWGVELAEPASAGRLASLMEQIAPTLLDGSTIILGDTTAACWRDPGMARHVEILCVATEWAKRFKEVIKMGEIPPAAQVRYLETLEAGGVELHCLPFSSPQGKDIERDYLRLGQRLRTTMPQAPFLLITAIPPTEGNSAPGTRSDKFFEVVWSEQPVASGPADLAPSSLGPCSCIDPRDGATLVLAGMVDTAFRAVFKDGQAPQTVDAECVTTCAPWIWRVSIRLYGGLGLTDLRRRVDRVAALMRADWIRVRSDGDLVELFVGAIPAASRVAPEHLRTVAELDFEQAWVDAKVLTATGEVPRMESMVPLDGNEQVTVYTFTLPAGLSETDVREGLKRVASTTRAGFLQIVAHDDPSKVVLMSAIHNPIPTRTAYDFESTDALVGHANGVGSALSIPWGTGVDGRPVTWRVKDTPHALVLGITGTGKSVTLRSAVYATLLAGWDVLIIDPVKGGADFTGLSPWLRGLGGKNIAEAEAIMRAVCAEVKRRKMLLAKHGVPDIEHLPDDVRPEHMLVAVDEFTSLMLHETVRRTKTTDPEVLAGYEQAEHENAQRASIGSLAGRIAREARSSGVHLLLGTQVLKADTIARIPGGDLKNNLGRLLLGTPTQGERMSGLRQPETAPVMSEAPTGRGVWEATTSPAVEMQAWFATVEDFSQALRRHGIPPRANWDMKAFMSVEEAPAYAEVEIANGIEMLDELVLDDLSPWTPASGKGPE